MPVRHDLLYPQQCHPEPQAKDLRLFLRASRLALLPNWRRYTQLLVLPFHFNARYRALPKVQLPAASGEAWLRPRISIVISGKWSDQNCTISGKPNGTINHKAAGGDHTFEKRIQLHPPKSPCRKIEDDWGRFIPVALGFHLRGQQQLAVLRPSIDLKGILLIPLVVASIVFAFINSKDTLIFTLPPYVEPP